MPSIWERLFGGGKPPKRSEVANDAEDVLEDIRDHVRREVRAGFDTPESIVEGTLATFEDEADASVLEEHARRCLDEELAELAGEQRSWPETTDCDRLDSAFAALDAKGILARQHFTCCGTCGAAGMESAMAESEAKGGSPRGYAFYHWQDTESAVDGYGICLNYGAAQDGEEAALAIGREIVAELERNELKPKWNGSWDERIELPLDWKRRRSP